MKILLLTVLLALALGACEPTEPPNTSLYLAMRRGDVKEIERHIAAGTDMNQLDKEGLAPLHVAVRDGRRAIVNLLLKHGVALDIPDHRGYTPLELAVLYGRVRIVRLLHRHGAHFQPTKLLLMAAKHGQADRDTLAYLVEQGANLEARNAQGDTPLLIAIRKQDHKLAKYLINLGARVDVRDRQGNSALAIAKSLGLRDISLLLLRNGAS